MFTDICMRPRVPLPPFLSPLHYGLHARCATGDLLHRMIEDFIRLAIDPVFPPPAGTPVPDTPRPTVGIAATIPTSPVLAPSAPSAADAVPASMYSFMSFHSCI